MEAIVILLVLVALAGAAVRWGVDSTDGPSSPEWERRRHWRGFRHTGGMTGRKSHGFTTERVGGRAGARGAPAPGRARLVAHESHGRHPAASPLVANSPVATVARQPLDGTRVST